MPSLKSPSTILVTGGNGYIGSWVVKSLLDRGFTIRAAVRSLAKAAPLEEAFPGYVKDGRLNFVVVEDILKHGAYDEALVGVEGVVHLASPLSGSGGGDDPNTLLEPAKKGTVNLLQGALKASSTPNSTLKRVLITSSSGAVFTPLAPGDAPRVFTEADWDQSALDEVSKLGRATRRMVVYRASKVLAERAAWEFYEAHKRSIPWDLVVLNPPYVFGPPLLNLNGVQDLGSSMKMWSDIVIAPGPKPREVLVDTQGWIDVRDLAEAHARALEAEDAGGERIVVSQGSYMFQQWLDIASQLKDSVDLGENVLPIGHPDLTEGELVYQVQYDTSKENRILNLEYRSKEETTKDILEWIASRDH